MRRGANLDLNHFMGGHSLDSPSGLKQVSSSPLAFVDEAFLSLSECNALIAFGKSRSEPGQHYDVHISPTESALVASVMDRLNTLLATESHADEPRPCLRWTPPNSALGSRRSRSMSRGFHVDTNGHSYRFATALVYLSDVVADGATVFPCSDTSTATTDNRNLLESSRAAGEALCASGYTHAWRFQDPDLAAYEKALADAAESGVGLSVHPAAGKLLMFYTLGDDGTVDPFSWHGGAAVGAEPQPGEGKWVLQLFKTVPLSLRSPEATRRFVAARRAMYFRTLG